MPPKLHIYDIIRRPLITEKSNMLADAHNQYAFEVALDANKIQIKEAIEVIFNKKVKKVNTMIMPAKRGMRGRREYIRKQQYKKAIVTLEEGETLELFNV
jgi:large subunit ribosomal protein L23